MKKAGVKRSERSYWANASAALIQRARCCLAVAGARACPRSKRSQYQRPSSSPLEKHSEPKVDPVWFSLENEHPAPSSASKTLMDLEDFRAASQKGARSNPMRLARMRRFGSMPPAIRSHAEAPLPRQRKSNSLARKAGGFRSSGMG